MTAEIVPFSPGKPRFKPGFDRADPHVAVYAPEVLEILRETWGYRESDEIAQMALEMNAAKPVSECDCEHCVTTRRNDLINFAKQGAPQIQRPRPSLVSE